MYTFSSIFIIYLFSLFKFNNAYVCTRVCVVF